MDHHRDLVAIPHNNNNRWPVDTLNNRRQHLLPVWTLNRCPIRFRSSSRTSWRSPDHL